MLTMVAEIRVRKWVRPSLLVLLSACTGEAEWGHQNRQLIYGAALEEIRGSSPDSLIVDARSRFLIPDEDGELRMGDLNRYGDPQLSAAIRGAEAAAPCRVARDGACDPAVHDRFTVISEPLAIGPREAIILATRVRFADGAYASSGVVLQVREGKGVWRVIRTWEGDSVRRPRGFSH